MDFHFFRFKSKTGARPARGQPAQVNPPPDPQLLADEAAGPEEEDPKEAAIEIFLRVFSFPQNGQSGIRSDFKKLTICSNSFPQLAH